MDEQQSTIQTAPERTPAAVPTTNSGILQGTPVSSQAPEIPEQTLPFGKPEGATGVKGDLPNYQEQWQSGESGYGLSSKPSKWDKLMGGLSQGAQGSFLFGTLQRMIDNKRMETGNFLQPEDANKFNPYRTMPYTTPVDAGIVAMEAADGRRKQQIQEWLGRNEGGNFLQGAGRFTGAFVDAPIYTAIGLATGGAGGLFANGIGAVGDAFGPSVGALGRLAGHYGWTLGEFAGVGQLQNKLEAGMGEREKPFTQVVEESVGGAAIATGFGMLARRFFSSGEATPEAIQRGIKESAIALANDEKPPPPGGAPGIFAERKAGVSVDPSGDRITPTVKTSPLHETPLYVASHADGGTLVHEHGLGQGTQFTDSYDVANNGVSKSSSTPGQIGESRLPEGAKLLDLDRAASEDYSAKESLLKKIEEKTGVPVDQAVKNGESLKDVITNLGDWAGVELKDGTKIPENILSQVQDIAKEEGYSGYQFASENSRQVHMFDPKAAGMEVSNIQHADPSKTPDFGQVPSPEASSPEAKEAQEKLTSQNYSPSVTEALNQIRKTAMTMHPENLSDQITETEKTLADHKQMLSQLAKELPEADETMKELREQEAHDKRMLDLAKRIMNCGVTE